MLEEEIVEMRWRCPDGICATENGGLSKVCRNCTRPKGPEVVDYFPDGDGSTLPALTEKADLKKATAGGAPASRRRDRVCYRCGQAQWRVLEACEHCGAPLAESKRDAQEPSKAFPPGDLAPPVRDRVRRRGQDEQRTWLMSASHNVLTAQRRILWWLIALMTAVLLAGGAYMGCRTTDTDVVVTHVAWVHAARMRCEYEVPDEGFDVPHGAVHVRDVGMRHHHYDDVFDHYEPVDESYWNKVPDGEEEYTCTVKVKGPKPPCYRGKCVAQGNGTASCPKICPEAPLVDDPNGTCRRTKFKKVWVPKTGKKAVTRREPRVKMWHTWGMLQWVRVPERDVSESGLTLELVEPRPVVEPGSLCEAPVERSYDVGLTDAAGTTTMIHPRSTQEFLRFPRESKHVMRTSLLGGAEIDPPGRR